MKNRTIMAVLLQGRKAWNPGWVRHCSGFLGFTVYVFGVRCFSVLTRAPRRGAM